MIVLNNITHTFKQGDRLLEILRDLSLEIKAGELIGLTGPSGEGKSTLLHIIGLLEKPSAGEVILDQVDTSRLNDFEKTLLRRKKIGFVYQFHHLLPEFSAEENVILPQLIAGKSKQKSREKARELLAAVNLSDRASHRPARLSGGEQQRVALARALANDPIILLADEPTGNLDHLTATAVFDMLLQLVHTYGLTALIVTHNLKLTERMDCVYELCQGELVVVAGIKSETQKKEKSLLGHSDAA